MAFKKLDLSGKVATGKFRFQTMQNRGGPWRIQISMPHSEYTKRFGDATRFDFHIGEGSDLGKIALQPSETGDVGATFFKSAVIFRPRTFDGIPEIKLVTEDPERISKDGMFIITLPTWWTTWRDILKARAEARRQDSLDAGRLAK